MSRTRIDPAGKWAHSGEDLGDFSVRRREREIGLVLFNYIWRKCPLGRVVLDRSCLCSTLLSPHRTQSLRFHAKAPHVIL